MSVGFLNDYDFDLSWYLRRDCINAPEHGLHIHGRYIECVYYTSHFIKWLIRDTAWVKLDLFMESHCILRRTLVFSDPSYISLFFIKFSGELRRYMDSGYDSILDPNI